MAGSGEDYPDDLISNYVGQLGALAALGFGPGDVLNPEAWDEKLTEDERETLGALLPDLDDVSKDELAKQVLSGEQIFFGSPRDSAWEAVVTGQTHPRAKRWKNKVVLMERKLFVMRLRDYHNRFISQLLAFKKPRPAEDWEREDKVAVAAAVANTKIAGSKENHGKSVETGLGAVPLGAVPAGVDVADSWTEEDLRRVADYRRQETERYSVPEKPFLFKNPWGTSLVAPLKRGPALDGGRPREHVLLRDERPSHVTILCLVRDAASRLQANEGTRQEICYRLRDSQYLREGATLAQLNQVVSGALDRLHYEHDACVRFDPETKHWCYLHNERAPESFPTPVWAKEGRRAAARTKRAAAAAKAFASKDGLM